jgi:very-short-patch-repair endonuclease
MEQKRLVQSAYHLPYNPDLVPLASQMRRNMTRAECRIWFEYLHDFKYPVYKQRPIDQYIVDFYCPILKLVIEVDGDSHFLSGEDIQADAIRARILEGYGLTVLRFTNHEVMDNLEGVIMEIEEKACIDDQVW